MFADTVCLPPTSMCSFQSVNVHVHKPCFVLSLILQINISSIHCMHVLMAHVSYDANLTSYSGVLHWYAAQPPPTPNPSSACSALLSDRSPSPHSRACVGVAQVHYDIWRHPTDVQRRQSMSHNTSLAYRLLPQSLQDAYADGNARLTDLTNGQVSSAASRHTVSMQKKGHIEQVTHK